MEFKRTASALSVDDLVAFANSDLGGEVLIGVEERKREDGSQFGEIIGHKLDDESVLQILNKAKDCIPPVFVRLYAENINKKPIIRVVIPQGLNRPYSTAKGTYCCRDGSRNRSLHPSELLKIFLETEARVFSERFDQAARSVIESIVILEATLEKKVESIGHQLGWAEFKVGDTQDSVDAVSANVATLREDIRDVTDRLRALFVQDSRLDPVKERAKAELIGSIEEKLSNDPQLLEKLQKGGKYEMTLSGRLAKELSADEMREVVQSVLKNRIESEPN